MAPLQWRHCIEQPARAAVDRSNERPRIIFYDMTASGCDSDRPSDCDSASGPVGMGPALVVAESRRALGPLRGGPLYHAPQLFEEARSTSRQGDRIEAPADLRLFKADPNNNILLQIYE